MRTKLPDDSARFANRGERSTLGGPKLLWDEEQSPRCPICLNALKAVSEPGAPVFECEHCGKRVRIWDYP